jgi:hypothetical protein
VTWGKWQPKRCAKASSAACRCALKCLCLKARGLNVAQRVGSLASRRLPDLRVWVDRRTFGPWLRGPIRGANSRQTHAQELDGELSRAATVAGSLDPRPGNAHETGGITWAEREQKEAKRTEKANSFSPTRLLTS